MIVEAKEKSELSHGPVEQLHIIEKLTMLYKLKKSKKKRESR